jgi:hypothetical protein
MTTTTQRPAAADRTDHVESTDARPSREARWPVAGELLDAFTRRDFDGVGSCLSPDLRFRALIPPGPFEVHGPDEAVARLRTWFGGEDGFEVLDASIGQLGPRLYLRWRVRMWPAGDPASSRVAEQHVFVTVRGLVESLDLLCSGFQAERPSACDVGSAS